jgi:hypothetical protein
VRETGAHALCASMKGVASREKYFDKGVLYVTLQRFCGVKTHVAETASDSKIFNLVAPIRGFGMGVIDESVRSSNFYQLAP